MITYEDERTKPTLEFSLNGISGELQNQHYPPTRKKGAISLNGSIERHPFKIEGEANLLARPPSAAVDFTAASLPLSLFAPQVKGRISQVDADNATVDVFFRLVEGSENPSYTAQLKINGLVPEKSGTNLATAFALLSGTGNGSVTIELDGQQPSRAIIDGALDSFSRTMVKASINPLLLADPEFVDLADRDFVTFLPGTDQFTGETVERLNRFGELLSTYPLVNLKITGLADPESDVEVLLEELKKAELLRVDLENQKRKLEFQQKLELEKMRLQIWNEAAGTINETDIPVIDDQFVPLSPQPVQVTSTALSELATRRQQAVIDYLTGQLAVDPGRLVQPAPGNSGIISAADSPRALIGLTDGYTSLREEDSPDNSEADGQP